MFQVPRPSLSGPAVSHPKSGSLIPLADPGPALGSAHAEHVSLAKRPEHFNVSTKENSKEANKNATAQFESQVVKNINQTILVPHATANNLTECAGLREADSGLTSGVEPSHPAAWPASFASNSLERFTT